ncbi:MAG: pantoate--beta-alanine ligase [Alphaproteobacteria bacterium]|nr:pantoate--beta-alanine ligase [Alphaproteobacteria bacterium]
MRIARTAAELRKEMAALRSGGGRIGFVPTMGALHAGHLSLVDMAKSRADHVVASIFVNPTQFGPNEDFGRYPRMEAEDCEQLAEQGVALAYLPGVEDMYPHGFATHIHVDKLGDGLCGRFRPGHFDGVATVVAKLLLQVRPDIAVFGEKDYQQLQIIRRMVTDMDIAVEILGAPIIREADGLAMSSRNAYLTPSLRKAAAALPRMMQEAKRRIRQGKVADTLQWGKKELTDAGFGEVQYLELCDAATLEPVTSIVRPARLLVAAKLGSVRLIDNIEVSE